jgi:hypothetical protein
MARVLVVSTPTWTDRRKVNDALREIEDKYNGPHELVYAHDGAAAVRLARIQASRFGWKVSPYEWSGDCAKDCPTGVSHRRQSAQGDHCPTARRRALEAALEGVDVMLVFIRPGVRSTGQKLGQHAAAKRGIAVWPYEQSETPGRTARRAAA